MSLLDVFSNVGTEIFYNIPKSIVTGEYQGIASSKKIPVPANVRFPMVGGVASDASLATKMFGVGGGSVALSTPSLKTVAIAGGGALAGYGLGSIFGGSKKQEQQQQQIQQQQPTQNNNQETSNWTYAPQTTTNINTTNAQSYNIISNSPNATLTKKDSIAGTLTSNPIQRLDTAATATQAPTQTASQAQKADQAQGTDWTTLAAIAGVALVAYGMTGRGRKAAS